MSRFPRAISAPMLTRPNTFFTLPCNARQRLYQNILRKPTSSRKFTTGVDLASMVAWVPTTLMNGLHATGLPWWGVIPLSAFLVRTFVVLPFFQIRRRRDLARFQLLQPLLDARMSLYKRWSIRKIPNQGWLRHRMELWWRRIQFRYYLGNLWKIRHRFIKRFGAFLVLAVVSDGMRRMCGRKEGLLSMALSPCSNLINSGTQWLADLERKAADYVDSVLPERAQRTDVQGRYKSLADWMDKELEPMLAPLREIGVLGEKRQAIARTDSNQTHPDEGSETETVNPWFQPSLQTGGLPFCKDLTKRDDSLILPILFVTSFAASIVYAPRTDKMKHDQGDFPASQDVLQDDLKKKAKKKGPFSGLTNLQRIFLTGCLFAIIPSMQLPSAMLMYFISNIGIGALQTRMLARSLPIRIAPLACRRGVRMNPIRERN